MSRNEKDKVRRTPNAPSATWSMMHDVLSAAGPLTLSESPNHAGPMLSKCLRAPRQPMTPGAGLVFYKDLQSYAR